MRITLESTNKIVNLVTATGTVPARIWEGQTASGIACHAYVTWIAVDKHDDTSQFELELVEQRPPTNPAVAGIPLRLVI